MCGSLLFRPAHSSCSGFSGAVSTGYEPLLTRSSPKNREQIEILPPNSTRPEAWSSLLSGWGWTGQRDRNVCGRPFRTKPRVSSA